MNEEQARSILETRAADGAKIVIAQEADWASIKRLLARCHEAEIPAMLGSCPPGG